MQYCKWQTGPI